jgi:hypothetical protein
MSSIDTQIAASTELIEPSVLKNGKTYYIESYG